MSYLGYQWENQVSILASRITLYLNKEIKLSFLSEVAVKAIGKYDKVETEYSIQGFCLSQYNIPVHISEQFVADLDCLHVNRRSASEYDTCFAVCAYPTVMQAWYDMMYDGGISLQMIYKAGGSDNFCRLSVDEIEALRTEITTTTKMVKHTAVKTETNTYAMGA